MLRCAHRRLAVSRDPRTGCVAPARRRLQDRRRQDHSRLQPVGRLDVHTVGPVGRGRDHGEAELLASCYRRSLELATDVEVASIAFPAISTGIYGYPLRDTALVAVRTVQPATPTLTSSWWSTARPTPTSSVRWSVRHEATDRHIEAWPKRHE